jgi:hypothetical protein
MQPKLNLGLRLGQTSDTHSCSLTSCKTVLGLCYCDSYSYYMYRADMHACCLVSGKTWFGSVTLPL